MREILNFPHTFKLRISESKKKHTFDFFWHLFQVDFSHFFSSVRFLAEKIFSEVRKHRKKTQAIFKYFFVLQSALIPTICFDLILEWFSESFEKFYVERKNNIFHSESASFHIFSISAQLILHKIITK